MGRTWLNYPLMLELKTNIERVDLALTTRSTYENRHQATPAPAPMPKQALEGGGE